MKTTTGKLTVLFTICFVCNVYAQQLVQSFFESNSRGNSKFSWSVSTAGDVNNDNNDDIIIGAPDYLSNSGRVYIYYGGSSMDNTADVVLTGESTDNYFGTSVASSGDVNNDNYDDVIIGAPGYNSNTGRVYIYYGGSSMDNTADLFFDGETAGDMFGSAVAGGGNINSDSYIDIIIGAPGYNSSRGRAYVYLGGNPMSTTPAVTMNGEHPVDRFGASLDYIGNLIGDGYDAFMVGAYDYPGDSDNNGVSEENRGKVYIYLGGVAMDNTADYAMEGDGQQNYFGYSLSGTGDVDNNGYDDLIISAYGYTNETGRAYVYYGLNGAFYPAAFTTFVGETTSNRFGYSVSGAGDLNNDGINDVIIGAPYYGSYRGKAYIYFGRSSGEIDTSPDITLLGEISSQEHLGASVSYAGDLNNDSYDDLIIGCYFYEGATGRAVTLNGASSMDGDLDLTLWGEGNENRFGVSVSGAGDVNNDGYKDVIVGATKYDGYKGRAYIYYGGSTPDNSADVILTGENTIDYFGYSVSTAGDINKDGYDDVIIGAPYYNSSKGRAYLYYGAANMNTTADLVFTGESTNIKFGCSVSTAGDVNGDTFDDIIVGAYNYVSATGRAYIFYGGLGMDNLADVTFVGESTVNYFGSSVACAGDVNGDTYDDVIIGAYAYGSNRGKVYIYFGNHSLMDADADVSIYPNVAEQFGVSVSSAGDVNNDGYDDVIIGGNWNNSHMGIARLYFGAAGTTMDATADLTLTGENTNDLFGNSVSGAGYFNNDAYADVIVGAPGYASNTGRVYIFYGGETMNAIADYTLTGEFAGDKMGYSVSGTGDVNNDGHDDAIMGAYLYPINGKVYLYSDDAAPLPVEITSFTTKVIDGKVLLEWQTATEVNNYGFSVERTFDPPLFFGHPLQGGEFKEWQTIGFVEGHGNSNSQKDYEFMDSELPNSDKVSYRLKQIDFDGNYEYSKVVTIGTENFLHLPTEFALNQNYPNPFNPSTTIVYEIPAFAGMTHVSLKVYDILGNEVKMLVNENQSPGNYEVKFNAGSLASGIYMYRIEAGGFTTTRKMILLK